MKLAALIPALAFSLALSSPSFALTKMGELSEYHKDYSDAALGARITSPSKPNPADNNLQNIITPSSNGFFVFADGVEQREEFTVDLGQVREVGMFVFEMTNTIVYGGEVQRKPNSLTVLISTEGENGPWTQVYHQDPADVVMSFALENVPARWIKYDLGVNTDGVGSRVRKAKVYKRYQLKSGPELMKEFHTQFKRDAEGLQEFWKAVDAERWEDACDLIIAHYAEWPAEPKGQPSPRVAAWMRNEVEAGTCIYKYEDTNWDWYRLRAECARQSQGEPPGASTILHLIRGAYSVTGDEAYAKQLAGLMKDWLQDLPCPGVHRGQDGLVYIPWSGILASQRTWVFGEMVHGMFKENNYWDRDLKINVLYSLWEHINYLRTVSADLGGNWLTNANSCMFAGAVNYPEFVQYGEWMNSSKSFFETSLARDFMPCGRACEDSSMYVSLAANQILGQYAAMKKAGVTIAPEAQEQMEQLFDCHAWMHYPDLSLPTIGDAHRESPLTKHDAAAPRNYVEMFGRQDLLYMNSQGKSGRMPQESSRGCSDCGWYTLRSAWDTQPYEDARQMFFKASVRQGHGHREQLSLTMYAYGREILTDPGNPRYGLPIEPGVRRTAVHNTICVDENGQEGAPGMQHAWSTTPGFDFVDAECSPYKDTSHRRQIVFLKSGNGSPDYWLVRDTVTGQGEHTYDINFHFSEGANPTVRDGSVVSTYAQGGNALIQALDQSVQPEILKSNISLLEALVPSNICRFRVKQAAPMTFETVIVPFKGANAPSINTEYLSPDAGRTTTDGICVRVTTDAGSDLIVVSNKPGIRLSFDGGKLTTDAATATIRMNKKGKIVSAFETSAGSTFFNGKPISEGS